MRIHDYVAIEVHDVIRETDDAISIVFDIPDDLKDVYHYRPGQFLTLRVNVEGVNRHRCYSLSSAPGIDERPKVTIKRVDRGLVSNELCTKVAPGDTLFVQPPAGVFVPATLDQDFLLFAGGSGVTPVLSILKAALAGGSGHILLVYANRDEASVIFRDELIALSAAYPARLAVVHWLESVQGLPTADRLATLVKAYAGRSSYICGPEPFMVGVSEALRALAVDDDKIHVERFVSLPDEVPEEIASAPLDGEQGAEITALTVQIDGQEHELEWAPQQKMLDTMLAAGIDAPYSCRVGGCSACMCRVLSGQVRMATNLVLDEHEQAEGWVLACQAYPMSPEVRCEVP